MDRKTTQELNQLSLETFGVKSKWRKLMTRGEVYEAKEEVTNLTIKDGKEHKEKMEIPLYHEGANGGQLQVYRLRKYTDIESVKARMLQIREERKQFKELVEKMQKEAQEKEKVKEEVIRKATGSSVKL